MTGTRKKWQKSSQQDSAMDVTCVIEGGRWPRGQGGRGGRADTVSSVQCWFTLETEKPPKGVSCCHHEAGT